MEITEEMLDLARELDVEPEVGMWCVNITDKDILVPFLVLGYNKETELMKSVRIHKTKCNWHKLVAKSCAFRMADIYVKNFYKRKERERYFYP